MNFSKKGIIVIIFLALVGTIAKAQTNDFSNTLTLGIGTSLLNTGPGFHVGYNPTFSVHKYFAVEGELSYFNQNIRSTFMTGNTGNAHSVNVLTGGRLYFNSEDKNIRPYINFLIGSLYYRETIEIDQRINTTSEIGIHGLIGGYVSINQFVLGLSYDRRFNLILKAGYTF